VSIERVKREHGFGRTMDVVMSREGGGRGEGGLTKPVHLSKRRAEGRYLKKRLLVHSSHLHVAGAVFMNTWWT
jgi:hypothetical protein